MASHAIVPVQQATAPSFTMGEMERVALAIARGGLFGSSDPNAVLTLCMVAQAEGKHPGLVMQQYHIISGKPAKKAEAMLVDFLAAGGRVEWHQLDDECADATFTHPLGGSARITWDKARVIQAQLGNNPMHKKYPRQMLRSRVVSEGVRTVFPGATSGLYVPEEVMDFDDAPKSTPPAPVAQRARDLQQEPEKLTDRRAEGRAKAEAWVAEFVSSLDFISDGDGLEALRTSSAKAMAKLSREHRDLYEQAVDAEQEKAAILAVGADHGYQHDGVSDAEADILAHIARKTTAMDVNSLVSSRIGELGDEAGQRVRDAALARIAEIEEAAQ